MTVTVFGSNDENISLEEFGLSEYESRVSVTTLKFGQMRIKDISVHSGVPRTKVYGVVKSLVGKGMAEVVGKDPAVCVPKIPEEVLSKRLNQEKRRFKKMFLTFKKMQEISREAPLAADVEERKFKVYSIQAFEKTIKELFANTTRSFFACLNWWGINVLAGCYQELNTLSNEINVKVVVGTYNDEKILEKFGPEVDIRITGKNIESNIMVFDDSTTVLLEESGRITEIEDKNICRLAKEIVVDRFLRKSISCKKALQIIQLGGEDLISLYASEEKVYESFVQAVAETTLDEEKLYQIGEKFIENLSTTSQTDLFTKSFEVQQPMLSALMSESLGGDSTTRYDPLTRLYTLESPMASKGLPSTIWLFALAGVARKSDHSFKILQNTSIQTERKHIIQVKIENKPLS